MGRFWDERAREDAMFFVDDREPYGNADAGRFWAQGERDLDHILSTLGTRIASGDSVVDVGCGVGRLTRVIARRAHQVYARVRQLGSRLVNGDTLGILVTHKSGANSLISAVLATPFDGRFALYGNKGWAEVRDKAHPEDPKGWELKVSLRGSEVRTTQYPPAKAVLANLEAFADSCNGVAQYPVPQVEMIANVSALEAVFTSARTGRAEAVEG